MQDRRIIDHESLSLDEWLRYIQIEKSSRDFEIMDYQFPTDALRDEYVNTISKRTNEEVNYLIELFLISGPGLGYDTFLRKWLFSHEKEEFETLTKNNAFLRRLSSLREDVPTWPSITWIVDLLPHGPQQAIQAIQSYFQAHCQFFPDGRIYGTSDAETLIKAKYMHHDLPIKETLLDLTPRDFELLVAYLYQSLGYTITITPRSRDGGYDVLAEKSDSRGEERLHIECKRYEQKIGVDIARKVLGTLSVNQATKAVIVTSSSFTQPAITEAKKSKRLELVDYNNFDLEMRKNIDYNWVLKIQTYIMNMRKSHNKVIHPTP